MRSTRLPAERTAMEVRAGWVYVGLDDVGDVDLKIECGDDAAFKVVLTPAEAVRVANALLALK
jgi:hypothetical protein